jgi:hypothetical protein
MNIFTKFLAFLAVVFTVVMAPAAGSAKAIVVGTGSGAGIGTAQDREVTIDITLTGGANDVNGLVFTLVYNTNIFDFIDLVQNVTPINDGSDYNPGTPPSSSEIENTIYYQVNDKPNAGRVLIAASSADFFGQGSEDVVPFKVRFRITENAAADDYEIGVQQTIIGPGTALDAGYAGDIPVSVAIGLHPDDHPALANGVDITLVAGGITVLDDEGYTAGDVNGDGGISLEDVKLVFLFFLGSPFTPTEFNAANVHDDGDGNTSISIHDVQGTFTLFLGGSI